MEDFVLNLSVTAPMTVALVYALRTAFDINSKFLPLLSIILGMTIGSVLGVVVGPSFLHGFFYGALAGSSATGTYAAVQKTNEGLKHK